MRYPLALSVALPVMLLAWSVAALSEDAAAPADQATAPAVVAAEVSAKQIYEALHKGMALYAAHSYAEALPLLTLAASHGLPEAQARLGYMYLTGEGIKRDGRYAIGWLGVAANSDAVAPDIKKTFDDAWKRIAPELVPQYQKLVDLFVAKYGVDSQGVKCSIEKRLGTAVRSRQCLLTSANGGVVQDALLELERSSSFGLSGESALEGGAASGPSGPLPR